jgi:hypothetical protein
MNVRWRLMMIYIVCSGIHRRLGTDSYIKQLHGEIVRIIAEESSKYTVSKRGKAVSDFSSVAAAVSAVPDGATIFIQAGIYDEPPMVITGRYYFFLKHT